MIPVQQICWEKGDRNIYTTYHIKFSIRTMIVIVERHEGFLREAVGDEYNSELVLSLTSHPEYRLRKLLIITESHLTLLTMCSVCQNVKTRLAISANNRTLMEEAM